MSEAGTLRAMARNYSRNNLWDHLDAEACTKAANKIDELTKQRDELLAFSSVKGDLYAANNAHIYDKQTAAHLRQKLTEQAAVIEKLIPALRFDSLNMSLAEWRDVCKVAEVARTDSKQILADYLREQIGEPVGYFYHDLHGDGLRESLDPVIRSSHIPLYKLPKCLK